MELKQLNSTSTVPRLPVSQFFTSSYRSMFLGNGGCGEVRKCWYNRRPVVVKRITRSGSRTKILREVAIQWRLQDHPNIVKVLGIVQWSDQLAIAMEFVPRGNLLGILKSKDKSKRLPWGIRLKILSGIVDALIHLHEEFQYREFTHGNVKSENVLITDDFSAKLSDFGATNTKKVSASSVFSTSDSLDVEKTTQHTAIYSAPELLKNPNLDRTAAIDIYSFGWIVYETITRTPAFSDAQRPQWVVENCIRVGKAKPNDKLLVRVRKTLSLREQFVFDILRKIQDKCLDADPSNRPPLKEVRKHILDLLNIYGSKQVIGETVQLQKSFSSSHIKPESQNLVCLDQYFESFRELHRNLSSQGISNQAYDSDPLSDNDLLQTAVQENRLPNMCDEDSNQEHATLLQRPNQSRERVDTTVELLSSLPENADHSYAPQNIFSSQTEDVLTRESVSRCLLCIHEMSDWICVALVLFLSFLVIAVSVVTIIFTRIGIW